MAEKISGWSTSNTKLASAFAALGFGVSTRMTEVLERGVTKARFFIEEQSARNGMRRDLLRAGWENGGLAKADAMHPFLISMAAIENYEALLDMQAVGSRWVLVQGAGGWVYRKGEEDSRLRLCGELIRTGDLPLAAALGVIGLPVVDIQGEPGARRYVLPAMRVEAGVLKAGELIKREVPGKWDLALEKSMPGHPLCVGYQATFSHAALVAHMKRHFKAVVLRAPGSQRRAMVGEGASGRVMDQVRRHFQIAG
jgi:hypothetical protein